MNKKLNNKRPANISLNPTTIDWKICNKEENSLISNALKIKGIIYKDFRNCDDIEGFYFINQENVDVLQKEEGSLSKRIYQ